MPLSIPFECAQASGHTVRQNTARKGQENCSQILHRARRHLAAPAAPTPASHARQRQVFTQFFQAWKNGDMAGLLQVLSDEIALHADGGDKVRTARHPLYGSDQVARYLLGILQPKVFHGITVAIRPTWINGQPGLIGYLDERLDEKPGLRHEHERKENSNMPEAWHQHATQKGKATFVMVLACIDNQIQEIDIIVNPETLRHLPARNGDDNGAIVDRKEQTLP